MSDLLGIISQGWFGTLTGFIGIVLAVIFFLRSRGRARLGYQHGHVTLVGGRGSVFPEELEIRYSGVSVPRVTSSRIVIWNCGNRTISGTDIVQGDRLRVELPGDGRILKHSILKKTRDVNAWQFESASPSSMGIAFDFLDPGDGLALEVIHSDDALTVKGTIRGIPQGLLDHGRLRFARGRSLVLSGVVCMLGLLMMAGGIFGAQLAEWMPGVFGQADSVTGQAESVMRWPLTIAGALNAVLSGYELWATRRRYPASLEPEERSRGDRRRASRTEPSSSAGDAARPVSRRQAR